MKIKFLILPVLFCPIFIHAQTNTFPANGNVGIGTTSPQSAITIKQSGTGVSLHPIGNPYFGSIAFNREVLTGQIYDPNGQAFQINNGGPDKNLHIQIYNGNGSGVEPNALVISGINGDIGIGTSSPKEKLSVNGKIRAHEVKVETANWPDYVFDQDYKILGLQELENYITANKHLPEIPSAKEVEMNGISLGEMNKLLLKKVEELSLHLIEKDKQVTESKTEINIQKIKLSELEKKYNRLNELVSKLINSKKNE